MKTATPIFPAGNRDLGHLATGRARASVTGVLWSFVNIAVSTLLTLGVFLVTSRILLPEDFGAVALAAAIISLAGTLVPVAFGEALIQRSELTPDHLDAVFWLTAAIATLGYLLLVLASPWIAQMAEVPLLAAILPVLSFRLLLDAGLTVPAALITRRMQFRYIAIRTTLANGIGAIVCLVLVTNGFALWALVASQLVTSLAALVVTALASNWRPRLRFTLGAFRDLRRFGLFSMGGRILTEARIDQLLLGLLLGPAALGLFFFARRLYVMLKDLTAGVFSSVSNVLLASLQHDIERRRSFFLNASFTSASLAFPVFAGFIAVAPRAVPVVFGDNWMGAVFAVQCFAVIGVMAGLGVMQAGLIRNLGRPDWWFAYQAVMQLSAVPIILLLYPYGLNWIMAGLVIRTLVFWPASVWQAQRMLELPLATYLSSIRAPALATLGMTVAVLCLPTALPRMAELPLLLCQIAGGASVYAALLAALAHQRLALILRILLERRAKT